MRISTDKIVLFNFLEKKIGKGIVFVFLILLSSCAGNLFDDEDFNNDINILYQTLSSKYGKIGVSDAANNGIEEFYFLFPTVDRQPRFSGKFNADLSPIVEISDDFDFKTVHQKFSLEGSGENKVKINKQGEFYFVNWITQESRPTKGKIYRIRIRINDKILGFVDVAIVSNNTQIANRELQTLRVNETLQVAFRIEEKVCPAKIELTPKEATVMVSGKQQYSAVVYNYYGEILENQKINWSISDGAIASIDQKGLVIGKKFGFSEVIATSNDVSATAYIFVQENGDSPRPGKDIVVFNDVNPFFDEGIKNPNNQLMVKNLINFTTPGIRNFSKKIWFDCGRSSAHEKENPTPCGSSVRYNPLRNLILNEGFELEDVSSASGTLIDIPSDVKVIFLWLPTVHFQLAEINALKKFAEEGGRIIFIGEWDAFYGKAGLDVENSFLINMGAFMRNIGKAVDCGYNTLPKTSLRAHPITRGLENLTIACASVIELGPNDFALFYDKSNRLVLAGVAQIETQPISKLASETSFDGQNLKIYPNTSSNKSSGF
ncbi:Ig-like domain-containing protein [Aquiflexum sp. LQ15W]|uniref:Ig-like domain-containing protein n=1 Tax=Cognataquiflexum nitidum TaxID=2922272 RepID=UPI001F13AB96|nr:Ig-like domain-containing protein [Cognataquiflexum nitidum]MCH6201420.1 Ig-like domain-containing protein [Cognataquiflexum nitidum]